MAIESTMSSAAPAARPPAPALPNGVLGMLIFLATEAMFFAGLISALLVLRAGAAAWPPPGQPRLPVVVTGANTLVLLASGWTMWRALARRRRTQEAVRWLAATIGLGALFLLVQGSEWVRLIGYGLRVDSGTFGSLFYTLIGAHGLHVLGGLVVVLLALRQVRRGGASVGRLEACRLYWVFVVGIWPLLYALVYLA